MVSNYPADVLCKLFVGNINKTTTDEEFRQYFDKYGVLKDIILMKDQNVPSQNRGFGFVTPESVEIADRILLTPNHTLDGRELDIKRAIPKDIDDPLLHVRTTRIFLGGLPHNITEDELKDFFSQNYGDMGNVTEIIIKKDRMTGRPRGFCFVAFDNPHIVDKLIVDNRYPVIHNKRCEIRKAESAVPIAGAPPSQLKPYPARQPASFASRGGQMPSRGRGGSSYANYNGAGHMGGGGQMMPPPSQNYNDGYPPSQNSYMGNAGYSYGAGAAAAANYSNPASNSMVGYPPNDNSYQGGYYQNAPGPSSQSPYQASQAGAGHYQMQDPRGGKMGYSRPIQPQAAVTRGRPY